MLVTLGAIPLLGLAFLPLGSWLMTPLENRFPPPEPAPEQIDGIVVLGGAESIQLTAARGQATIGDSAERLTAMVELARAYPDARLVFSGGPAFLSGSHTSAAVARDLLTRQGFDVERVVFENQARDTYENAQRAKELVVPAAGEQWLLVTSARHMPRAVGVFRAAGWPVIAYPVDYRTTGRIELDIHLGGGVGDRLADLDLAAHEWGGLAAYYLLGRTDALFPSPRDTARGVTPAGSRGRAEH